MKKLLATLLAISMLATSALAMGVPFEKVREYPAGKFTDVPADAWYADNVKAAYELQLIDGKAEDKFAPDDQLLVVEAVKIAATVRSIYVTGKADFAPSSPWYQTYVDYATAQGIYDVAMGKLTQPATRAQFARIFAGALPEDALSPINQIPDGAIPDVAMEADYAPAAYQLYRAGVLTGSGDSREFAPDSQISRKEAAAIVTRMADPTLRKTFTLGETPAEQPEAPVEQPSEGSISNYASFPGIPDYTSVTGVELYQTQELSGGDLLYLYDYGFDLSDVTLKAFYSDSDKYVNYLLEHGFESFDRNERVALRSRENPNLAVSLGGYSDDWGSMLVGISPTTEYISMPIPGELAYYPETNGNVPDFGACMGLELLMQKGDASAAAAAYAVPEGYTVAFKPFFDLLFDLGFVCRNSKEMDGYQINNYYVKYMEDGSYYSVLVGISNDLSHVLVGYGHNQD